MTIVSIMAGFSFGYCVMDIIRNYQTEKRLNKMLAETVEGYGENCDD
jgi:hypothetical protein